MVVITTLFLYTYIYFDAFLKVVIKLYQFLRARVITHAVRESVMIQLEKLKTSKLIETAKKAAKRRPCVINQQ